MKIESLTLGQIVYDAHKTKMGNTTRFSMGVWTVRIISVDLDRGTVTASWNTNEARIYNRKSWSKWRKDKAALVTCGWAKRLATRAEIKAMKEQVQS